MNFEKTATVELSDWASLRREFRRFFSGVGTVTESDDEVVFASDDPAVETGLALTRDGRTTAFMPLHGLDARWHRITFDSDADEVMLESAGVTYVYRVPGSLRKR